MRDQHGRVAGQNQRQDELRDDVQADAQAEQRAHALPAADGDDDHDEEQQQDQQRPPPIGFGDEEDIAAIGARHMHDLHLIVGAIEHHARTQALRAIVDRHGPAGALPGENFQPQFLIRLLHAALIEHAFLDHFDHARVHGFLGRIDRRLGLRHDEPPQNAQTHQQQHGQDHQRERWPL